MQKLSNSALYDINGGYQEDYDFGYKIGRTLKKAWNWAADTWSKIFS